MSENVKSIGEIMREKNFYEEMPAEMCFCPKHGEYIGAPLIFRFGNEKKVLSPPCLKCEKEEQEKEERQIKEDKRIAAELEKAAEIGFLTKMNIGKIFWNEDFDTFNPYTPELKQNLDICASFAKDHQGRMLIMLGKNGNGKDHLAASILKKIGGYIYTFFEIELMIKDCYSPKANESETEVYKRLWEAPLLVINEIGRHKANSEWSLNFFSNIIDKRYQNILPTILISNKHLKDDCNCPDCLHHFLGNDILSRVIENGEILHFNEDDYRYKKREMRQA
jgi:DNA replication protein DnaC